MRVTAYQYDRDLKTVDLGQCDVDRALAILDERYANGLRAYEYGEDALVATSFGLSRSAYDFVSFTCNGQDNILVTLDRISDRPWWTNIIRSKESMEIPCDIQSARGVIQDYCTMDRAAFELKYEKFACY